MLIKSYKQIAHKVTAAFKKKKFEKRNMGNVLSGGDLMFYVSEAV